MSDAILLQNVMSGPHPTDISTLRPKIRLPDSYKPVKGWKVAWSMDLGSFEVDPEVRKNTLAALDVFRSLGCEVQEVDLGWGLEVQKAGLTYLEHLFGAWIAGVLKDHRDEMTTYARAFAEKGAKSKATDFVWSLQVATDMYNSFGPMMQKHDIFICPTTALPAVPADFDQSKDEVKINGKTVNPMLGWVMTTPFNTLSRCPVMTVPSGRAKNGVPTGIQIVGRTYRDQDVFRAAMAYEKACGPWFADAGSRPKL